VTTIAAANGAAATSALHGRLASELVAAAKCSPAIRELCNQAEAEAPSAIAEGVVVFEADPGMRESPDRVLIKPQVPSFAVAGLLRTPVAAV
jgi:hypothetical protein